MASIEYVVNATGNLSAFLEKAGLTADRLDSQLGDLSKRIATPEVDLKDTKFTLGMVNAAKRLDKLSAMVADPKVEVDTEKAQLEILRINTMLDRLDAKHVTATVKVDVDRSALSRLRGLLPGGGGGAVGGPAAGGGALASSAAGFAPGLAPLLSNPYAAGGIAAAGAAVLPFAATAVAGSLVTVMGGAFTAIAVIAASKNKQVAKSFTDLKTSAVKDLQQISAPFVGVLESIAKTAQKVLPQVMKPFGDAIKSISGPFQQFATTLIKSFGSSVVAHAIRDIGGAFGALLKSLAPSIPSIINSIASGIDGIAQAIQAHPRIFADMINFLGHLVGWSLQAVGALTRVANWLVQFTRDVGHWLNVAYAAFAGFFTSAHNSAIAFQNAMVASFRAFWHNVVAVFNNLRSGVAAVWNTIWSNTRNVVTTGINNVVGFFRAMPGRVLSALTGLGHSLGNFAAAALNEMWNGFKRIGGNILGWFGGFAKSIISVVKKVLGVFSPSSVFFDIGVNLMRGLEHGVKHGVTSAQAAAKAAAQSTAAAGRAGAGVQQWRGVVLQALRMEGLSPGLLADVLYQMQTESGGNPRAINLTDINAQMGTPSKGLMQVIDPTFRYWHWPGTSWDIYNPLANIAAALNYAAHGKGFGSGIGQIGSGHGYAAGGIISEPIWGIGASGRHYSFGERGPEIVIPGGGGSMSTARVEALLAQILRAVQLAPSATSAGTARALNSAARAAVR